MISSTIFPNPALVFIETTEFIALKIQESWNKALDEMDLRVTSDAMVYS